MTKTVALPPDLTALVGDLASPCIVVDALAQTILHNKAFLATFRCDTLARAVHASSRNRLLDILHEHQAKTVTLLHPNDLRLKWTITPIAKGKFRILTAVFLANDVVAESPAHPAAETNMGQRSRQSSPEGPVPWKDHSPEAKAIYSLINETLESAPIGISISKLNGSLVWGNSAWLDLWDLTIYDDPNLYRTKLDTEYMKLHGSRLQALQKALQEEGTVFEAEFPTVHGPRYTSSIAPLKVDKVGIGFIAVTVDITERFALQRQAYETSQQRDRTLREVADLTELSDVGLLRFDTDGHIEWANDATFTLLNLSRDQAAHIRKYDTWGDHMLPEYQKVIEKAFWQCFSTGTRETHRVRLLNETVLLITVMWRGGNMMATITDVTQLAGAEKALLQVATERETLAAKAVAASEAARSEAVAAKQEHELLVNVISHEIRSPISAIYQNTETVRDSLTRFKDRIMASPNPSEAMKAAIPQIQEDLDCLDAVLTCAAAQERVSNDVLGLGSITANKYTIAAIPQKLPDVLETTLRPFKAECKAKGIDLRLKLSSVIVEYPRYIIDPQRVSQVITNCVANAMKFLPSPEDRRYAGRDRAITVTVDVAYSLPTPTSSPRGSPKITPARPNGCRVPGFAEGAAAESSEEAVPGFLRFQIADTGIGMTKAETQKLFQLFSQSSEFTHSKAGGSGLGLWIAKRLCELQGGTIDIIFSEVGRGSTFEFYIAAKRATIEELDNDVISPVHEKARSSLRLLFVDDNNINRMILKRQLSEAGHLVDLACNGQEALIQIQMAHYDAVIMDFEMPVMDGIRATEVLKTLENGRYAHLPVLGCSASIARVQEALSAGMTRVITKPYKIAVVLDSLDQITNVPVEKKAAKA